MRGATCFEDLITVDNKVLQTFHEAPIACKLIKTDDEWDHCLREAVNSYFSKALYQLLSFILIFHNPTNAQALYDKYKLYLINPEIHEIISVRNVSRTPLSQQCANRETAAYVTHFFQKLFHVFLDLSNTIYIYRITPVHL